MAESPIHQTLRETAQIIPFPTRHGVAKTVMMRNGARASAVRLPKGAALSDFGSGWYHDAAVQEDTRKCPLR